MGWRSGDARRLGKTLRELRNDRGMSQEDLAHASGLTKNQMSLLERGRGSGPIATAGASNPRMETLAGIAEALGMSVSELLAKADL